MIIKSFELNKINLQKSTFILFYGKNEGFKNQVRVNLLKDKIISSKYDEKEILDNTNNFLDSIYTKSLFETEKVLIIKRATDKIFNILSEIIHKNPSGIIFIIEAGDLDKRSKLRNFFEKDKNCVCVPFYLDNEETLSKIGFEFLKKKKNFNFIF